MTVGKIFSGLLLLPLVGIFVIVRFGSRTSEPAVIVFEPVGSEARLPHSKNDQMAPAVGPDGSTVFPARRQSLSIEVPSLVGSEGLLRREYIAVAPPIPARISPLRIESYPQRFVASSVSLPRALERVPIVAPPIPLPRIETGGLEEGDRMRKIIREIEKSLRELKEREKLNRDLTQKMAQQQLRSITHPVIPNAPRRP